MVRAVESLAADKARVLEVGPGTAPFSKATVFVDWQALPNLADKEVHALDINQDPLPFPDQSFDFVYCRHTLEDIYNPVWVCREMARVGRAGYVETPSPIVECCRGVDGGSPTWRGYHHHRYVIWVEDDTLTFIPKYPFIEYVNFGEADTQMIRLLNSEPMFWNTYFFWDGSLPYRVLNHDQEYRISVDYGKILINAVQKSFLHTKQIAAQYLTR